MTLRNGRHDAEDQLAGAVDVFVNSTVSFAQGGSVGVVEASAAGSADGVADVLVDVLVDGVVWVIACLQGREWG
ncbi:hypothetical protein [Geodermatophilus sp. URMC 62]|uniref:hypothetical protein n=1 Tax=Geodermatophilus sp. URMC 62 TaxID=3423414 RepID=UPI00406D205C